MVHAGYANQALIDAAVERAVKALAPDVVRIRYSFEDDWTGDPSVFFRIVLSDEASDLKRLAETSRHVREILREQIDTEELGLHSYENVRSLSEQNEMRDPMWD